MHLRNRFRDAPPAANNHTTHSSYQPKMIKMLSQKVTTLSSYNFDVYESIWTISGINITEKISNQQMLYFLTSTN